MRFFDLPERLARHAWRVPLLGRVLAADYARWFDAKRPSNRFRGVYASFAEAEAAIPRDQRTGYDHDAMQGMYRHRMDKPCESDYPVLFWLREALGEQRGAADHVFDFGGHAGVSWYGWREALRFAPTLRWTVCDVPAIAREGEALAQERGVQDRLRFTSDAADGADATVLLVAGSLQYVDFGIPELLAKMGARPRWILVNKQPLHDGDTFVTVQSTGRAFHPYRIDNRAQFIAGIVALGYRVVDDWTNREVSCRIPFVRGHDVEMYSGYCFVRDEG
ncbi:MAG: TIGR04325 family methyltransferase [Lysobacteraceae bacterium]